jgi:hypothetical protein
VNPTTIELLATILFAVAILHTFLVSRFAALAARFPEGSVGENVFHILGEVEVVFGFWATIFLIIFAFLLGGDAAVGYLEGRYTLPGQSSPIPVAFVEPIFVFVIMAMAATRPILEFVKATITGLSRLIPARSATAFYITCLIFGPLLGSFITEPAAMTVTALLLKERFYDRGMSSRFMYATLGLLFVNISIGGTLTNFAAPPVVMVASKWDFDITYMLTHFGWKAALAVVASTLGVVALFKNELARLDTESADRADGAKLTVPVWLIVTHIVLIAGVVLLMHHMAAFMGLFLLFLGVAAATREYQDELKLREALLVGYFLMGLVVFGALQKWWLQPTLSVMSEYPLFFGATGLTAITDNAALTFLGSQVEGLSDISKYMLVAGAVTGGGLTVIANAPNPAGFGILKDSFGENGISPLSLFVAALPPTIVAMLAFLLLPNLA